MRVVIANFRPPLAKPADFPEWWSSQTRPRKKDRYERLLDYSSGWGFHIFAIGLHMMDLGLADDVEFWDYGPSRRMAYHSSGVLKMVFHHAQDVHDYVDRTGPPDLFVNYGVVGHEILRSLEGRSFRVHVPCSRYALDRDDNHDAECFLVDDPRFLDDRSMLYVPVVNTRLVTPGRSPKTRDFIYLANIRPGKRHDILLDAVRGTALTGHLHPVKPGVLDLSGTSVTTSDWDERSPLDLLQSSRIAVYPGDRTSNPAALWECVAAGLPIVVNEEIAGGRHVVVPGVTGELASPAAFGEVMRSVLADRDRYTPRAYFETTWGTVQTLDSYLAFFRRMGWTG